MVLSLLVRYPLKSKVTSLKRTAVERPGEPISYWYCLPYFLDLWDVYNQKARPQVLLFLLSLPHHDSGAATGYHEHAAVSSQGFIVHLDADDGVGANGDSAVLHFNQGLVASLS